MANEKRDLVAKLGGYATFASCSKSDVTALVEAGKPFSLPTGWPLVQEGIPSDACYVLTEGTALVFHDREQIATVGEGDVVGEMTLLGGGYRRATVTSSSHVAGLRIDNEPLQAVLAKHDALAKAFEAVRESRGSN